MHFDRIHVKQGKSMPRKRKYMDPAGSTAGEASALPPSTQTQPEPRCSRTRRPGDKWLKTASEDSLHGGFRYESVYHGCPSASASPVSGMGACSDDGCVPPGEVEQRSRLLSPSSVALQCWESEGAIRWGAERGDPERAMNQVYRFHDGSGAAPIIGGSAASATRPLPPDRLVISAEEESDVPAAAKRWQWWWFKPVGAGDGGWGFPRGCGGDDDACAQRDAGGALSAASTIDTDGDSRDSLSGDGGGFFRGRAAGAGLQTVNAVLVDPAQVRGTCGVLVKSEHGAEHLFVPLSLPAGLGAARPPPVAADARPPALDGAPRQPQQGRLPASAVGGSSIGGGGAWSPAGGAGLRLGGTAGVGAAKTRGAAAGDAVAAAGRAKRVWRRWDASEEQALREAVDALGTKDWAAIHDRMRTDRSIKQVPPPSALRRRLIPVLAPALALAAPGFCLEFVC
jgi:hypothetical protein